MYYTCLYFEYRNNHVCLPRGEGRNSNTIFCFVGYSALHHAAAWGRIEVLKLLYFGGGDIQQKTFHGERPVELARRYHHLECADFLDWAGESSGLFAFMINSLVCYLKNQYIDSELMKLTFDIQKMYNFV